MALASDRHSIIIRTERGLTITGTRITLYDVMDHLAAGWTPKLILNWLPLTEEQLHAALSYIDANPTEVEAEYQNVLQATQQMREYWEAKIESGWLKLPNCLQSQDSKRFMLSSKPGKRSSH